MHQESTQQMDMFDDRIPADFIYGEKIKKLEEQQNNLRKGLFKRWKEQEGKIQTLSELLGQVLKLLENEGKDRKPS